MSEVFFCVWFLPSSTYSDQKELKWEPVLHTFSSIYLYTGSNNRIHYLKALYRLKSRLDNIIEKNPTGSTMRKYMHSCVGKGLLLNECHSAVVPTRCFIAYKIYTEKWWMPLQHILSCCTSYLYICKHTQSPVYLFTRTAHCLATTSQKTEHS